MPLLSIKSIENRHFGPLGICCAATEHSCISFHVDKAFIFLGWIQDRIAGVITARTVFQSSSSYFFMCLLTICISSLEECLLNSIVNWVVFRWSIFKYWTNLAFLGQTSLNQGVLPFLCIAGLCLCIFLRIFVSVCEGYYWAVAVVVVCCVCVCDVLVLLLSETILAS